MRFARSTSRVDLKRESDASGSPETHNGQDSLDQLTASRSYRLNSSPDLSNFSLNRFLTRVSSTNLRALAGGNWTRRPSNASDGTGSWRSGGSCTPTSSRDVSPVATRTRQSSTLASWSPCTNMEGTDSTILASRYEQHARALERTEALEQHRRINKYAEHLLQCAWKGRQGIANLQCPS